MSKVPPGTGYCPNHATGLKLPDDFVVTPLQYVNLRPGPQANRGGTPDRS